jgi:ribosome maturation factor RimP
MMERCSPSRRCIAVLVFLLQSLNDTATGFSIQTPATRTSLPSSRLFAERRRSVVDDPYGATPDEESEEPELVDPEEVPELQEMNRASDLPYPIPHQSWRKGDTSGCEAPISAPWRREAEEIIAKAVSLVGGSVLDVTWYLTAVLVTIDEEILPERTDLIAKAEGPVIDISDPTGPIYEDPSDPKPEEIWDDEDDILYQRETPEEAEADKQLKLNRYAPKDSDDSPDEPHITDQIYAPDDDVPLYMNEETRDEVAMKVTDDEQMRDEETEKPIDLEWIRIDTAAISVIAKAILDALQDREEELAILQRHELVLTSPGPPDVIETQRQFDAYRGAPVIVETQDPFNSNRTLKGKLVDRNSMDLMINQKGRIVTIPLNFVKCVRLPPNFGATAEMEEEEEEAVLAA